jgi:hypothetical protein
MPDISSAFDFSTLFSPGWKPGSTRRSGGRQTAALFQPKK